MRAIRWTFAAVRAWVVAGGLLLVYGTLYLLVAKALVIDEHAQFGRFGPLPHLVPSALSTRALTDWFSPAFVLYASDAVVLAPSVPAIVTVLVLGMLVGINGAIGIEAVIRRPSDCEASGGPWWIAAALPSFVAAFSCCAPTVLLLLGAGAAGAVLSFVPVAVPVAGVLLLAALRWSAQRLERTTVAGLYR